MARKKSIYAFEEANHSGRGILATVLGGISLLIFIILLGICAALQGSGGAWIGSFGFTAFVIAFCGMVFGLNSFHEQCKSYIFCKVGTLLCGFMVAVWFLIFCVGLAS
ncbi:MAG: DUF6142 family protein [Lachnospiraceae bacterium]|nr:DUF6142 family protein [Lachnospiraceae bacterium]MDD3795231.1 DUF6142 family protein [Lachnospiraceae bacterium]